MKKINNDIKLPKYFSENIIQLENSYFTKPNLRDLKYLILVYKNAIEYYALQNNMKSFQIYQKKLIRLTNSNTALYLYNNINSEENKIEEVNLLNLLDKLKLKVNVDSQENIENNFLKINYEYKQREINTEKIINDSLIKQTNNFKEKLKNKKKRNKNENKENQNINNNIISSNQTNQNIENIIIENLEKINEECSKLYNERIENLLSLYNQLYNDKVENSNKYIEVLSELNLMLSEPQDNDTKKVIEQLINSAKEESKEKINEIIHKLKNKIIKNIEKINSNELLDNDNINDISKQLLEKIVNTINK